MAQVRIDGVSKSFGPVAVLNEISLDLPDGKFVILVGPSGCGKTTLLRLLAGLEDASGGRLYIGERDVTHVHPRERDIAMVFQSYALYPHMTVRANMAFALKIRNTPEREIERRIAVASDILGIAHLLDRQPKQLSGGQRQRVALGRAIVREPSVFLFDEPLSNLDAKLRTAMRAELIKLHKRLGTTIVYVTHDQVEAMTMAELVVVMKDGLVQQSGAPMDIYRRPENLFVAEFIGSPAMNFLEARLQGGEVVLADCTQIELAPVFPGLAARASSPDLVLGIRPEHLAIAGSEPPPKESFELDGIIEVVEPLGAETMLEVACNGISVVARVHGDVLPAMGDSLKLRFDMHRLHCFDKTTGLRIS